jgi:hypothetical protein
MMNNLNLNVYDFIVSRVAPRLSNTSVVTIPVNPIGRVKECHQNVQDHVAVHGGEQIQGWIFQPTVDHRLIRAFWHSVWRSTTGETVDLTPDPDFDPGEEPRMSEPPMRLDGKRLFLPAHDLRKEGDFDFQTTKNKTVRRFVRKMARIDYHYRRMEKRLGIPFDMIMELDLKYKGRLQVS